MSKLTQSNAAFTYAVPTLEWADKLAEPWTSRRLPLSRLELAALDLEQAGKVRLGLAAWVEDNAALANAMLDRAAIMRCDLPAYVRALFRTNLLEAGAEGCGDELPSEIASAFLAAVGQQ